MSSTSVTRRKILCLNNHANGVLKAEREKTETEKKNTFEEVIVQKFKPKVRNSLNSKWDKYKEKHTKPIS